MEEASLRCSTDRRKRGGKRESSRQIGNIKSSPDAWPFIETLMTGMGGKRPLGIGPKSEHQRQNNDDQATDQGAHRQQVKQIVQAKHAGKSQVRRLAGMRGSAH